MKNFCCSGAMACHPSSRLASAFRPAFLSRGLPHPDSLNSYYCQITWRAKWIANASTAFSIARLVQDIHIWQVCTVNACDQQGGTDHAAIICFLYRCT
jgi:hypothetical protein